MNALLKTTLAAVLLVQGALVAAADGSGVGQITHLSGTVAVKRADGTAKVLSVKSDIQQGDTLSTQNDTYARVKFVDGAEVVLRPNTEMKVASYSYNQAKPENDNVVLSMFKGGLRAVTGLLGKRNHDKVSFSTPTATIGIRGTHFGALFCNNDCGGIPTTTGKPPENGLHVDVTDGAVNLANAGGQQLIGAGQFGFVRDPQSPPAIVPPQQGIQVTMPTSIADNKGGGKGIGKGKDSECTAQ